VNFINSPNTEDLIRTHLDPFRGHLSSKKDLPLRSFLASFFYKFPTIFAIAVFSLSFGDSLHRAIHPSGSRPLPENIPSRGPFRSISRTRKPSAPFRVQSVFTISHGSYTSALMAPDPGSKDAGNSSIAGGGSFQSYRWITTSGSTGSLPHPTSYANAFSCMNGIPSLII
jgi:hypothetical protein